MRTKNYLHWCAAALTISFANAGWAQQPTLGEPALSSPEREELRNLLRQFDPERPNPENLPIYEQRWLLIQLQDLSVFALAPPENETLTVCDTIGDPHLEEGDVVTLTRIGSVVRMEIVRNPGAASETHPWVNTAGGNVFVLNPSISGRPHRNNPAFKKFTPEAVGRARVNTHPGGAATDHDFFLRRQTRTPDEDCDNPDPLMLSVPEQHTSGGRHGGHAVLN